MGNYRENCHEHPKHESVKGGVGQKPTEHCYDMYYCYKGPEGPFSLSTYVYTLFINNFYTQLDILQGSEWQQ